MPSSKDNFPGPGTPVKSSRKEKKKEDGSGRAFLERIFAQAAPIFKLSSLEFLAQGLGFILVVLKFRYFGASIMGVVSYFGALGEIPASFYSIFNRSLVRFVPAASKNRKTEILVATICYQVGVVAVIYIGIAAVAFGVPRFAFWRAHLTQNGLYLGIIPAFTMAFIFLNMLQSLFSAMVLGMQRIVTVQVVKNLQIVVHLASFGFLYLAIANRLTGLWIHMWMTFAVTLAAACIQIYVVSEELGILGNLHYFRPRELKAVMVSVHREQFRKYTFPQQFTALLSYVKENLAVLFLGQMGMMSDAGVYNLANKVYGLPRRFIPQIMSLLMPRMVLKMENDRAGFRKKYDDYSWAQYLIQIAVGTALFASLPLIRMIFKVGDQPGLAMVFYFFSANLVLNSVSLTNLTIIELGKDMRWYTLSVTFRIITIAAMTAFLVPYLGNAGATIALVASTVVQLGFLAFDTRGTDLWSWDHNYKQFAGWLLVLGIWGTLFLAFPKAYPFNWISR